MQSIHFEKISSETKLNRMYVAAVASLLADGATVPFIARYRKEATGSMDEVSVMTVRDRLEQLEKLDERRKVILRSLDERELLTAELSEKIGNAGTLTSLEDIYLPFRPRRRTRATKAREKGLEPLAQRILLQKGDDPFLYALEYVDSEKGVDTVEDAVSGARDIIAEDLAHNAQIRDPMRRLYWSTGSYGCRVISGMEQEGSKFRDYFEWNEPVRTAPSHRVLAMRRGEEKKFLSLRITVSFERALDIILPAVCLNPDTPEGRVISEAASDGFRRLLAPSMETETRLRSKEAADEEAIRVFTSNLRELLLAAPLGPKGVLAVDPGFRTGCKLVCLNSQGSVQHSTTIFPFMSESKKSEAVKTVIELIDKFEPEFIAVGNGTAGRETEAFLRESGLQKEVKVIPVNESGASIYSASKVAREEFPDFDLTVRGAISIGRRLQDPLAELVKIDPKSIGVGQYQHDVDSRKLRKALDDTVESCVNSVGVDLNTASSQLLSYVSGLTERVSRNIVKWSEENGAFLNRRQLLKVSGLGPAAFEQSAGFLRIRNGQNPLDASAVHPESYSVVERMAGSKGLSVAELMSSENSRKSIDLKDFVDGKTGLPTLRDIMEELEKPGRDPRKSFQVFNFADVHDIKDLEEGMILPGIVTNVTNFGAFVDIGVHQDGLVHISQMADRFVKNPADIVSAGEQLMVRILQVDVKRGRISLSMTGILI
ncbi:RNA-binding transcriptional accessory protein [Candidatus Fermentibacteria bacterium]|nr:MAG: RNA-binding transcriptional accessory protein [Candidatus Fermentibacteria bacterium]